MKKIYTGWIFGVLLLWTGAAHAVTENCNIVSSAITKLRAPEYSAPVLWKGTLAEKGTQQFSDVLQLEDKSLILGGSFMAPGEGAVYQPLLAHMEVRGKILWSVKTESKTGETIDHILRDGKEIVTLGGIVGKDDTPRKISVARYDMDGNRASGFTLAEGDGNLMPAAIVKSDDGGYYIAARYENLKIADQRFGVVYKVTKEGERLWRRAYMPGLNSTVDDMIRLQNGDFLLAGGVTDDKGLQAGWLVRIDDKGGLRWQQSYPRGAGAHLNRVAQSADGGHYIAAGASQPLGGGDLAGGWILQVDSAGNALWERFFSGPYDLHATDLTVLPDSRALAGFSATAGPDIEHEEERLAHLRMMTLSPRGQLLSADSFTDGHGLTIARIVVGAGQAPVLAGMMGSLPPQGEAKEEAGKKKDEGTGFDGWAAQLQSLPSYDDPCLTR